MNKMLTKIIGMLLGVGFLTSAFGQIVSIQTRHVDGEDIAEFVHRETEYWSEVAKYAINQNMMVKWELWRVQSGTDIDDGANFLFLNEYQRPKDVDRTGDVWNPSNVFPDKKYSELDTQSLSTVVDQIYLYAQVHLVTDRPQYMKVNYARASNLGRYLELENTVWQDFVKERMDAKETNVVSWDLLRVISPGGADMPFNAITIDGFAKLSDVLEPSYGSNPEVPDLAPLRETHEKAMVKIYSLVKGVYE